MKAGIAMDSYKATTFRKNLQKAGFKWTEHPGLTDVMLIFQVEFTNETLAKLTKVVTLSNNASQREN